jgi:SH3-like domain-containing protein
LNPVRGGLLFLLAALTPVAAIAADAPFRPHYVSQRVSQVSLREGPGYAYKILWVYRHKGYPFRENARFDIWRRVTAADGTVGWVNGQLLSDVRTVLVTGKGRAEIRKNETPDSQMVGLAEPDAVLGVKSCGPEFCRVRAARVDGWVSRTRIWGVDPGETFK